MAQLFCKPLCTIAWHRPGISSIVSATDTRGFSAHLYRALRAYLVQRTFEPVRMSYIVRIVNSRNECQVFASCLHVMAVTTASHMHMRLFFELLYLCQSCHGCITLFSPELFVREGVVGAHAPGYGEACAQRERGGGMRARLRVLSGKWWGGAHAPG